MRRPALLALSACLASAAVAIACARNPVTGKRQFTLVSESQEIELGKQSAEEVKQTMPRYPDEKVQAYVSAIGMRIAKHSERPNLPWQFTVVDDPTVNAFALPGGPIFVTRGILTHMTSEAELASVVGHEIGHVTARHSVQQISKQQLAQLGLGLGMILRPELAGLGQAAGSGLQLLFLKFGRDAESQADELGFKYMTKEGWDPKEMPKMFATLERVSSLAGGGRVPTFLSTHPDPGDREKVAEKRAATVTTPGLKAGREEFLAVVNGMTFGEDPRQGYFKGSTFVHPGLKLQVDFPQGWKTQNGATAVVGVSPKQDAMIQFGSAGKASPQEAAQKFLSQQGVQAATAPGQPLPANASYFQAQTQDGAVAGLVAFASLGGATYGILGYTAAQALSSHDAEFRRTLQSLKPLADPAAAAVQPARIELVKVPRDMSLAEFQAEFPSSAPVEQVAIVNGLDPKAGRFTAGQTAKRITGGPPIAPQG